MYVDDANKRLPEDEQPEGVEFEEQEGLTEEEVQEFIDKARRKNTRQNIWNVAVGIILVLLAWHVLTCGCGDRCKCENSKLPKLPVLFAAEIDKTAKPTEPDVQNPTPSDTPDKPNKDKYFIYIIPGQGGTIPDETPGETPAPSIQPGVTPSNGPVPSDGGADTPPTAPASEIPGTEPTSTPSPYYPGRPVYGPGSTPSPNEPTVSPEPIDPSVQEDLDVVVGENDIVVSMNLSLPLITGESMANVDIVNEAISRHPQVVEIYLKETGELIYQSGIIPIGYGIEKIEFNQVLDVGDHVFIARIYNVDYDGKALGYFEAEGVISVKS